MSEGAQVTPVSVESRSAFISHASPDAETAERICRALEAKGFTCWIAPRDVRPGENYGEEIIRGIENSHCMVLVWSDNTNASRFVADEIERAYSKGKPIFPMRIHDVLPSRKLELFVSSAHWIDARGDKLDPSIAKLALQLGDNADLITGLPDDLQRRIRRRRWMRIGGSIGVSTLIAIAVAVGVGSIVSQNTINAQKQAMAFSKGPQVSFYGSLVGPSFPLEASMLVEDGYDQDGVYHVFKDPVSLSVYDISTSTPQKVFEVKPEQFASSYDAATIAHIKLPRLPMRVAACMSYDIPKTKEHQIALSAFTFGRAPSAVASFPITEAGPLQIYPVQAGADCAPSLSDYISTQLAPINVAALPAATMTGPRESLLSGGCLSSGWTPGFLDCMIALDASVGDQAKTIQLGFAPDSQPFTIDASAPAAAPAPGMMMPYSYQITVPDLGPSIYAALHYADGSTGEPKALSGGAAPGISPSTRPLPSTSAEAPPAFVYYEPNYLPKWSIMAMAPAGATGLQWSRDGVGYTTMKKAGGSLSFAEVTPSELGIAVSAGPPPVGQSGTLWLRVQMADGTNQSYQYPIDPWEIARQSVRKIQPIESAISCSADPQVSGTVNCAFDAPPGQQPVPNLLFSKISWGTDANDLHDLTGQEAGPQESHTLMLGDWRRCKDSCSNAPFLIVTQPVSSIFFKFQYWTGEMTEPTAFPVH